jgi:hypothetical protein
VTVDDGHMTDARAGRVLRGPAFRTTAR